MIFLSSGVARLHRKARDDPIALLLYRFSTLSSSILKIPQLMFTNIAYQY